MHVRGVGGVKASDDREGKARRRVYPVHDSGIWEGRDGMINISRLRVKSEKVENSGSLGTYSHPVAEQLAVKTEN